MWSDFKVLSLLHEILHISGNIESTKIADHILEMRGIINSRILLLKVGAANYVKIKDDLKVFLILSCFVGHPVNRFINFYRFNQIGQVLPSN